MPWGQRLKRGFDIDIETCTACGGALRIIACIDDPALIEKIVTHLDARTTAANALQRPPCQAPPQRGVFNRSGSADDHHPGLRRRRAAMETAALVGDARRTPPPQTHRRGGFARREARRDATHKPLTS